MPPASPSPRSHVVPHRRATTPLRPVLLQRLLLPCTRAHTPAPLPLAPNHARPGLSPSPLRLADRDQAPTLPAAPVLPRLASLQPRRLLPRTLAAARSGPCLCSPTGPPVPSVACAWPLPCFPLDADPTSVPPGAP
nr:WAS/WASL-interacting protein family member 3-like [Aegilops tauschii subsp. strangulata]